MTVSDLLLVAAACVLPALVTLFGVLFAASSFIRFVGRNGRDAIVVLFMAAVCLSVGLAAFAAIARWCGS